MAEKRKMSRLKKAFGMTDEGEVDLPNKASNVRIARIAYAKEYCPWCFPHGIETPNSRYKKNRRSWKNHRKTQHKTKR